MLTFKIKQGNYFGKGTLVQLDDPCSIYAVVKDRHGAVVGTLQCLLIDPVAPSTKHQLNLYAFAGDTQSWPLSTTTDKLVCDIKYDYGNGVVINTPTFNIFVERRIS